MRMTTLALLGVLMLGGCGGGEGTVANGGGSPKFIAGFRELSTDPAPLDNEKYWEKVAYGMAAKFAGATPGGSWSVGMIGDNLECWLTFPAPDTTSYPNIMFGQSDDNEKFLSWFDAHGVRVWLNLMPGNADVKTLIKLVLDRYSAHPSVIGIAVDVEWLQWNEVIGVPHGRAVTDDEATAWSNAVRGYNLAYTTLLRHWLPEKMPPTARQGLVFLDDAQQAANLAELTDTFAAWGQTFAPAPVAFQIGYDDGGATSDKNWWSKYPDPPAAIGTEILKNIPNTYAILWVAETATVVFPP